MIASCWANKVCFLLLTALLAGCGGGNRDRMNDRLVRVLDSDLAAMVSETTKGDTSAALAKPYYRVDEYKLTEDNYRFGCRAEVTFFYFKKIRMKQTRKYRYSRIRGEWERYAKDLTYNLPKPRQREP